MKKKTQHSDKFGKIVSEGEVVEVRKSPGVTFASAPKEVVKAVAEVVEVPKESVKTESAPKVAKKSKKKSSDKE